MEPITKALSLPQTSAGAVVSGIQHFETRDHPPIGLRPAWYGNRTSPGLRVEPGERIAIHVVFPRSALVGAGRHGPPCPCRTSPEPVREARDPRIELAVKSVTGPPFNGTAQGSFYTHSLWLFDRGAKVDISNQLAYGDWSAGCWAWEFADPAEFDAPIPCLRKGGGSETPSGLWRLPTGSRLPATNAEVRL